MRIEKIEKILKSKVKVENKKRTERVKNGYDPKSSYARPLKFTEVTSLNWQVRNKIFKGCNGKATFDPNTMQAYSYKHWRFVDIIRGKIVFNNYKYSHTTTSHQYAVKSLLKDLGIRIDLEIEMNSSLSCFKSEALPELYEKLARYDTIVNRKGTRRDTKEIYIKLIREVNFKIKMARRLGAICFKDSIQAIYAKAKENEVNRLKELAVNRVERANETKAIKSLEQTAKVIDINQFSL